MNPPLEDAAQPFVLDGGLATELERRGHDLNHPLWSARVLLTEPEAIQEVHEDFLEAGADIVTTATYQATMPGLEGLGLSTSDAVDLFELAISLAFAARDKFVSARRQPLVAGSIGPYGAYLTDGSEYVGDYEREEAELVDFHGDRFEILADSELDLLACETIPSFDEACALASLIDDHPDVNAWISFTCRDDRHLSDGTPIVECARLLDGIHNAVAVGVNCCSPALVPGLITEIRRVTEKPVVVYPNSGERYDLETRQWLGAGDPGSFAAGARRWHELGASIIGGCCRTTPNHIRQISGLLTPVA